MIACVIVIRTCGAIVELNRRQSSSQEEQQLSGDGGDTKKNASRARQRKPTGGESVCIISAS